MKKILILILLATATAVSQTPIIFDSDIAPDYDDVGAMALLHAFADKGEAKILATISCNAFETTAPTLSVLNTYFNRPEIPVGITKTAVPHEKCSQKWAEFINAKYPHPIKTNVEAEEAVQLYRKILVSQPDKSVTIITVGFFTNLSNLLLSPADQYSSLTGKELVAKKVKQLVSMAAGAGKDDQGRKEYNVIIDIPASVRVFREWPTPMTISGFEIGEKVLTGIRLINNAAITNSPVKDAFQVALKADNNLKGRNSWDQTAVLVAVKGMGPWFSSRKIDFDIKEDGTTVPKVGDRFTYLTFNQSPEQIATVIEDLMMHQPKK